VPIFHEANGKLSTVGINDFAKERDLQRLIESNLETTFGCRLVATEFNTGLTHNGRIDTLAISEEGSPVIIEYKKARDSNVTNQALFYLDWIKDHRGDFEMAVQRSLGDVEVDWSTIRVICIASSYDRYTLHAVRHIGSNIELWRYRRFANGTLELERESKLDGIRSDSKVAEVPTADGYEIAVERPIYSVEMHEAKGSAETLELFQQVNDFILGLDDSITLIPNKHYVAYKLARNLVCLQIRKSNLTLWLNRQCFESMPDNFRDVTSLGHLGTGDIEVHVGSAMDLEIALEGIQQTYNLAGGS
jgi:predicted transport protein